ncbi:Retrotransposable element SLACS 132 kDa protein [Diplonema papillatum]|nr:Retrotransposable element SLACS 132 kDa protein [Diplonema papillatum]
MDTTTQSLLRPSSSTCFGGPLPSRRQAVEVAEMGLQTWPHMAQRLQWASLVATTSALLRLRRREATPADTADQRQRRRRRERGALRTKTPTVPITCGAPVLLGPHELAGGAEPPKDQGPKPCPVNGCTEKGKRTFMTGHLSEHLTAVWGEAKAKKAVLKAIEENRYRRCQHCGLVVDASRGETRHASCSGKLLSVADDPHHQPDDILEADRRSQRGRIAKQVGAKILDTSGAGGDCGYRAINYARLKVEDANGLRKEVGAHIRQDFDTYTRILASPEEARAFALEVESSKKWMDMLTLQAISEMWAVCILVIRGGDIPVIRIGKETNDPRRVLVVAFGNGHYEKVRIDSDGKEKLWKMATKAVVGRLRGSPATAPTIEGTTGADDIRWWVCPELTKASYSIMGLREGSKFFCPMRGCSRSQKPEGRIPGQPFSSFEALKGHINSHRKTIPVPESYLRQLGLRGCSVCGDVVLYSQETHADCRKKLERPGEDPERPLLLDPKGSLPQWKEIAQLRVRMFDKVPRPVQRLWAETYVRTLRRAVDKNDESSYRLLYMLPKACLRKAPGAGGKRNHKRHANDVKSRLQAWNEGEYGFLWSEAVESVRNSPHKKKERELQEVEDERLARATVLAKLGRYSQGNKALTAKGLAEDNEETWKALESKHPKAAAAYDQVDYGETEEALEVTPENVLRCIRGFPRGSGAGPSAFKAQYIRDAVEAPDVEGAIAATTEFVNLLLSGRGPELARGDMAGATLIALRKKEKDVRPIAVGEVWRRLASKSACAAVKSEAEEYLVKDNQVGVAVPGGLEAAVQVVRSYAFRNEGKSNKVMIKVDLKNAFNSVHRSAILRETKSAFPELLPWVKWCYAGKSNLYMRGKIMSSEEGAQQGDPMGPLLFSLAIAPIVRKVRAETGLDMSLFYLDDGFLAGNKDEVMRALELFERECAKIGLEVNRGKCELILLDASLDRRPEAWGFPKDTVVLVGPNFSFLGAPIGNDAFCAEFLKAKVDKLRETFRMLKLMDDKQAAYLLLRYCTSYGKMVYYMRAVPGRKVRQELRRFDDMVHDAMQAISNSRLSAQAWSQAKLAIRYGGLGLRSTRKPANPQTRKPANPHTQSRLAAGLRAPPHTPL